MGSRVPNFAPVGSLLKQPAKPRAKVKGSRKPREHDDGHLEAIRQCPCIVCGIDPAGEAAHIRMMALGKPLPGMGAKPDDRFVLPLCHQDHTEQHRIGERQFWKDVGIDPLVMAERLYRVSPNTEAMRAMVMVAQAIAEAN
jgi:hypothetical protein